MERKLLHREPRRATPRVLVEPRARVHDRAAQVAARRRVAGRRLRELRGEVKLRREHERVDRVARRARLETEKDDQPRRRGVPGSDVGVELKGVEVGD